MNKGILVVVSGFSGAGKGTVMKRLMEKYDGYALSVSATTRKPRPGEEDGREYFFRTRDEFEKLIEEDALLEYAVCGKLLRHSTLLCRRAASGRQKCNP